MRASIANTVYPMDKLQPTMKELIVRPLPQDRIDLDRAISGKTVCSMFLDTVAKSPDVNFLRWREGRDSWPTQTFAETADRVARIAAGLRKLGIGPGSRVILMMSNRPEFHVADLAVLFAGGTPISIYNSSSSEQVNYIVGHAKASVMLVDSNEYFERVQQVRETLPELREIVMIDPPSTALADVVNYQTLLREAPLDLVGAAMSVTSDQDATIIYTSGTTGRPKGVRISHYNVWFAAESNRRHSKLDQVEYPIISYLPMAHIAERCATHYMPILHGCTVTTCPNVVMVLEYLKGTRPNIVFGVPRIWEKMFSALQQETSKMSKLRATLIRRAAPPENPKLPSKLHMKLYKPILKKMRFAMGLDCVVWCVTGGAPISKSVIEWFRSAGVPLTNIYGMSESTGPIGSDIFDYRDGSTGRAIPGSEVVILDDGEIVVRGGHISSGYLDDPERTAESFQHGWLRTGDIGRLDEDGFIYVLDRKKELIVTAGGENISPANLETELKSHALIAHACVIGDQRPYITALIALDFLAMKTWAGKNATASTIEEFANDPAVVAEIQKHIDKTNAGLARIERVKRFKIVPSEWVADADELTPTLKVKRKSVAAKYFDDIEALYNR